jgi:hypothetical protein
LGDAPDDPQSLFAASAARLGVLLFAFIALQQVMIAIALRPMARRAGATA